MCVEAMDTATSKRIRSGFLRKTAAWKLQWRLLRASAEEDEARKESRAATRKPPPLLLRRHQRRTQLVKLARALGDASREAPKPVAECKPVPFLHSHHHGAMAPENTTQYLMSNTYGDMGVQDGGAAAAAAREACARLYGESLSPRSVYDALDCDYDSCLAFQQRDFEEEFGDLWDQ